MVRDRCYHLGSIDDLKQIEASLPKPLHLFHANRSEEVLSYWDSFDWRLYQTGLLLLSSSKEIRLFKEKDGGLFLLTQADLPRASPFFSWDLKAGEMRQSLEAVVDARALCLLMKVRLKREFLQVINEDNKTVVRLFVDEYKMKKNSAQCHLLPRLGIETLRGYEEEAQAIADLLISMGHAAVQSSPYEEALELLSVSPKAYSSKVKIKMNADDSSAEVVRALIAASLHIIKKNTDGILADIDTEFLHDQRVAIRRLRSLIGQLDGVFSSEIHHRFKSEFGELSRMSNAVRDLDVWLLEKDAYRTLVPPVLLGGLNIFFKEIKSRRQAEHRRLLEMMQRKKFHKLLEEWERFCQEPSFPKGKCADQGIRALAESRLKKSFAKICKEGQRIDENTPDEEIHRLRLQCKKLRYLFEFFASLFSENHLEQMLAQLKQLQNHLGAFNDLHVQQVWLEDALHSIKKGSEVSAAIGALMGAMYQQQLSAKKLIFGDIRTFIGADTRELMKKLLAQGKK